MSRSRDRTHHFVHQLRILIDGFFEVLTLQGEYVALAQRPQADRMFMAVNKAEFAREVTFPEDSKAGYITPAGMFHYLQLALVLGTELFGVSDTTLSYVDQQINIPMMGVSQSLNVSVACAVVLYEAQRQRQAAGMYDNCRLDDETLARQRFEWLHPVLADYCQRHELDYPPLSEAGELAQPMPIRK